MAKPKLAIWGAAGQARVVAEIVRLEARYELVGFLDDVNPQRKGLAFCNATILGGVEQLQFLKSDEVDHLIFGFGNNRERLKKAAHAEKLGFHMATAVHPRASVSNEAILCPGTVVKAGAIVDPDVTIGQHALISAGATVSHGCVLEEGARLSGGANLAAEVRVGRAAWIGVGASVRDRVRIGSESIVGAGSVVVSDIPKRSVAYGVPAQVRRPVKDSDH